MKEVLQKFISSSGYCSRRKAEELIRQGKVFVNGEKASLGMRVDEDDKVKVGKEEIRNKKEKIYVKLNKPAGYTCTNRKFRQEKNVFDLIDMEARLFVVGRLDKNSRGLLLLTNDGDMAERMTHPRYGHEKEYLLKAEGLYKDFDIKKMIASCRRGFDVEEIGMVKMEKIEYLGTGRFRVILCQGKKRQIRRMFEKFGLGIEDLKRIRINTLELSGLSEGKWAYLTEKEKKDLMSNM
ncbi:pseudouridine synthase [Candidatus Falkowbacteria bacterium]|nr:pseudouridine synthase [Candidatus Falkowbacteria bacterium]